MKKFHWYVSLMLFCAWLKRMGVGTYVQLVIPTEQTKNSPIEHMNVFISYCKDYAVTEILPWRGLIEHAIVPYMDKMRAHLLSQSIG